MSQLLTELRKLIEDESSEDYTDTELAVYLNKYRNTLDDYGLSAETDDYLVWLCPYKYLDNVVLDSATDTPIDSGDYTADDINGIYTFTVAQSAIYIKAQYYDLYKTASDIWLVRAARCTFSGAVGLSDETIPQDKLNREYCIQKYWDLRQSDSTSMERE